MNGGSGAHSGHATGDLGSGGDGKKDGKKDGGQPGWGGGAVGHGGGGWAGNAGEARGVVFSEEGRGSSSGGGGGVTLQVYVIFGVPYHMAYALIWQ